MEVMEEETEEGVGTDSEESLEMEGVEGKRAKM